MLISLQLSKNSLVNFVWLFSSWKRETISGEDAKENLKSCILCLEGIYSNQIIMEILLNFNAAVRKNLTFQFRC